MSLSKVESNEDNYRIDSFDDRICDDLCEFILKYLSLEDKLRLECVSKQFQRTAFLSQCLDYLKVPQINGFNIESYKQLFKKYSKINTIIFDNNYGFQWFSPQLCSDLIELIIKYCNNITHIQFKDYIPIETEDQNKFFDMFGHQLISITNYSQNIGFTFTSAPNIEELTVNSIDTQLTQIEFKRLKSLNAILSEQQLDSFETFIENNAKTLKYLDIGSYEIRDKKSAERLLKIVTKAINLIHLGIHIEFRVFDKSFANNWKEIAINCKQIKSLRLRLKNNENLRINDSLISILKQFKRLKRLDLNLFLEDSIGSDFHPFEDLKGFEGLTHFTLRFDENIDDESNESFLTDIDINFPKLKYLEIFNHFNPSVWTADVLSRLTNLEVVFLMIGNCEVRPQIERQLIKNCKKFRVFYDS